MDYDNSEFYYNSRLFALEDSVETRESKQVNVLLSKCAFMKALEWLIPCCVHFSIARVSPPAQSVTKIAHF